MAYYPVPVVPPNPAAALCCGSVQPHVPVHTHWEAQFSAFLGWLPHNSANPAVAAAPQGYEFVIRLTTTINFGRTCGTMEYVGVNGPHGFSFVHVPQDYSRNNGFTERSAFKNYKCTVHGIYFQLDLQRRPGT
ncbi:hypothetical protein EXIGLDRAFT_762431 [Exidia glandulosa HHB12029]|uniref:Uncharacterized protein n=1 Tax=Exidia glandulosa HHB12029 TaxID=1314781 RepID=A0A165MP79_EXIGL|nr:hypothetical protein EXIGLDRAFT_762431 [Exidia glandulosa HHB12029]